MEGPEFFGIIFIALILFIIGLLTGNKDFLKAPALAVYFLVLFLAGFVACAEEPVAGMIFLVFGFFLPIILALAKDKINKELEDLRRLEQIQREKEQKQREQSQSQREQKEDKKIIIARK